uniref:Keratin-associated protein 12-2 n=1 Tax=Ailuropoda melanoleuca TaxID=9646 RepID=A0A7N5JH95_AILME
MSYQPAVSVCQPAVSVPVSCQPAVSVPVSCQSAMSISCQPAVSVPVSCQPSVSVPVSSKPAMYVVPSSHQSSGGCQPTRPTLLCRPTPCSTPCCL